MKRIFKYIGIFLVLLLLFVFVDVWRAARSMAKETLCCSNLSRIGMYAVQYQMDHEDAWPASFRQLANYCKDPAIFNCPATGHKPGPIELVDQWSDYILVTNLPVKSSDDLILAYCKPENHKGKVCNVIHADGSCCDYWNETIALLSCDVKAHSRINDRKPQPSSGDDSSSEKSLAR